MDKEPLPLLSGAYVESLLTVAPDHAALTVPRGRYLFERSLVIGRPVKLRGEGDVVFELLPGRSTSLIEVRPSTEGTLVSAVVIEDLVLVGNRDEQNAGSGITILSAERCEFRRLKISRFWEDGIYCSDVRESKFEELVLEDCGRNGLSFGEAIPDQKNTGNTISQCEAISNDLIGFDAEPGDNNLFVDCTARGNASYGFSIGAEARSHDNELLRCVARDNRETGINIWSDANEVRDCVSISNGGDGVSIIGPVATENSVIDCTTKRNARHGIGLDRASKTTVSGNRSRDNGRSGVGNGIALVAETPAYDNVLRSNEVSGESHNYALVIMSGVHRTVLEDNSFTGPLLVTAEDVTWR